jgi:hypothetical protein
MPRFDLGVVSATEQHGAVNEDTRTRREHEARQGLSLSDTIS